MITAVNDQAAVDIFREQQGQIALVILDLIMPVMEGSQCLEEILKVDAGAKVLIARGYYPEAAARDALEGGAKGFVGKPFNLKELL